jgi:anthranilate phosphoribosyltransferase
VDNAALLKRLTDREHMSRASTAEFFDDVFAGRVPPEQLGAILKALADKGETVDEIVGAATALRRHVTPVRVPRGVDAIDTCGTGGDGKPVFNVSTAVAIVAAAAGATVAKHGNRSNARPSGSAEVLTALGVNVEADVPVLERCLERCGIAFLYAARLHPAMRFAAPVRRALGIRTIFNLIGPLTNPAGVRRQLLGVNRPEMVEPMLAALRELGAERAVVVCGMENLCDISIAGPTRVGRWDGARALVDEVTPESFGLPCGNVQDLLVANPEESAMRVRSILDAEAGAARDIVLANAAAALWVAGLSNGLADGVEAARRAIDSRAARERLAAWVLTSRA